MGKTVMGNSYLHWTNPMQSDMVGLYIVGYKNVCNVE